MLKKLVAAGFATAILIGSGLSAQSASYKITDIAAMGNTGGPSCSINNLGQIVGWDSSDPDNTKTYIWKNGIRTDLPSLGGRSGYATAINDAGVVVGVTTDQDQLAHYCKWVDGAVVDLGIVPDGHGSLVDINNSGQIIGTIERRMVATSFVISDGVTTTLPGLTSYGAFVLASNDQGQIAGIAMDADKNYQACVWQNGAITVLASSVPGWSYAYGINNAGDAVGDVGSATSPALWHDGQLTVLDILPDTIYGRACSINDQGQIAGFCYDPSVRYRACLWQNGQLLDLNSLIAPDSGWLLSYAYDINNSGQIVGMGYHNGECRTFLLDPTAVPEPSSILALMTGMMAVAGAAARRRK